MRHKKERKNEAYVISAEYQVLNILYKDISLLENHPELTEESFPHKQARDIFSALFTLFQKKENISELSVLREANQLNETVSLELLSRITNMAVEATSFETAFLVLKKESVKYKLSKKVEKLSLELEKMGAVDEEYVNSLLWDSQQIVVNNGTNVESKTLPECLDDYVIDLNERKLGSYKIFGDLFLDENLTRKASGGQIILISASTGMGKSAYALNALNGMINLNIPSMYFTLEMDEISTMDRLVALRTNIPISDWYKKENIDSLLPLIEKEKVELHNKQFRLIDNPSITLLKIQSLIREFKIYYKTDYVCVFIDLITQVKEFIDSDKGNTNLAVAIERAVNKLNEIAKNENVCFVCVAQMNRTVDNMKITKIEDIEKLKPTLGSIKNSGALAERARVVLSIFRRKPYAERYLPDDKNLEIMSDIMDVTILKQNQGGIAIGKYIFDGTIMSVTPFVEEESIINF